MKNDLFILISSYIKYMYKSMFIMKNVTFVFSVYIIVIADLYSTHQRHNLFNIVGSQSQNGTK